MKHKTFDLLETKTDEENGTFTALASVFGTKDLVGDRVMPGAFAKTLKRWREKGKPIPIILSHQWENPMAQVGWAEPRAVMETDDGLVVQGKLDVNDGNPWADQVYKLMKRGTLDAFSFGYTIPEGGEEFKDGANNLNEINLVEIGPTLKGAHPDAGLQAVKSAVEDKAARNVGPEARARLHNLIAYYMKKPHPFTACVRDNTKRFGPEGAKRVCATLKDIGEGTTHWRDGGHALAANGKQVERPIDAPEWSEEDRDRFLKDWEAGKPIRKSEDAPERDFVQELYTAAEGNMDALMEMWDEHQARNGDKKDLPAPEVKTVESDTPETAKPPANDPLLDEFDRAVIDARS